MKKQRITYAICFLVLFLTEVYIALFVHDDFIRPYIGDVFVTALICCFCRVFFPKGVKLLPLFVLIFSFLVEATQYINLVSLLGLENNVFFCTILGTSFSHIDLVCYAAGCLLFWAVENAIICFLQLRAKSASQ